MPYYFTGLARVARTTGYPVIEVDGWEKRGHGPMLGAKTIKCHHTAGGANGNFPSMGTVLNGRTGLSGPLSHYGLGRDGTIYVIAAGLTYHAGASRTVEEGNSYSIGIEAENTGDGTEPWGAKQLDSYVKLCRALVDEFGLDVSKVQGHKETAIPLGRKPDPRGIDMDDFRAWVKRGYYIKATVTPTASPTEQDGFDMASLADLRIIVTKAIDTAVSKLATANQVNSVYIRQREYQASTDEQIRQLAEATKTTIDYGKVKEAAKAGASAAIAEGVTIEGTATVELKAAE